MTPLFRKLNLGTRTTICVLNAPTSFEPELAALEGVAVVRSAQPGGDFVIAFAMTQVQLDTACRQVIAACPGDLVLWIAYPKGTSRRYTCDFNRDSGWPVLGAAGFETVRQVAIDEDWSALRFRRAEYIKQMTRNPEGAISKPGAAKARRRAEDT